MVKRNLPNSAYAYRLMGKIVIMLGQAVNAGAGGQCWSRRPLLEQAANVEADSQC